MYQLALSGPTGVGKSTLTQLIATQAHAYLVPEPHPKKELEAFEQAPAAAALALQTAFIQAKARAISNLPHTPCLIIDRTIQDREVFSRLHHQMGYLTQDELTHLYRLSYAAERTIGKPDAAILLTAEANVLYKRMRAGNRPGWLIKSLPQQLELYDRYIGSLDVPHLVIDTTHFDHSDVCNLAATVAQTMGGLTANASPDTKNLKTNHLFNALSRRAETPGMPCF
jgi:deoxyadenosine/deoxycytidine kinase